MTAVAGPPANSAMREPISVLVRVTALADGIIGLAAYSSPRAAKALIRSAALKASA